MYQPVMAVNKMTKKMYFGYIKFATKMERYRFESIWLKWFSDRSYFIGVILESMMFNVYICVSIALYFISYVTFFFQI